MKHKLEAVKHSLNCVWSTWIGT